MIPKQEHINKFTNKRSRDSSEEISSRMDYLYEANPHLSDVSYPDDKIHYYEFINNRYTL